MPRSGFQSWWRAVTTRALDRQQRGRAGEAAAGAYLRRIGYEIEATNARFPVGEIDLVAQEKGVLCFIEVRARTSARYGTAAESITWRKRQRFLKAVQWYLQRRQIPWRGEIRFDVVTIELQQSARPDVHLIRGAFRSDE